jgi:hypothetical protein
MRFGAPTTPLLLRVLAILLLACGLFGITHMQPASAAPYATTITVNTGQDFNTSLSESCATFSTACSLRRAIVQARALPAGSRPALIQFNIPATVEEGYDAASQTWVLNILAPTDQYVFRDLIGNQITIDGSTQPGGRSNAPKILLRGPGTGNKNGINISSGSGYVIRDLAFQNFRVALMVSGTSSTVEDNWFGLNVAGNGPHWRDANDHSQGSGLSGFESTSTASGNTIQDNVFLGLIGNAAVIRGNANTFLNNRVGTAADGTLPGKQTEPSLLCTPVDWFGGSGLLVDGPDHIIEDNLIAGIRLDLFSSSTQPDAIWLESTCDRCIVRENKVGVDSQNADVGVCGQGVDITNGEQMDILNNVFANTSSSAIFLNGSLYKDNTLSGNIIRRSSPWLKPDGSSKADDAILRFSGLPDAFEFFNPAKVTSINGTAVAGVAGDGNPCPNCVIEVFLDDDDGINEALQLLATTTANASGAWSVTLPAPLARGFGLRTTSTSAQYNTIPGMNAGTTAGLSVFYPAQRWVYLPMFKR